MKTACPLFIAEDDVRALLTMKDAVDALEQAFQFPVDRGTDGKTNMPRQRAGLPDGFFNVMAATLPELNVFGLKAYYRTRGQGGYHVLLYSQAEGRLLAVIEADYLSQLRTGGASGIATRYLARPDAAEMALIGTGKQAFWQVAAVAAVRPLRRVRVHGRTWEKADALARRVEAELAIEAVACKSAADCVEGADVVATITASETPVCKTAWIAPGMHVNAAGANTAHRQELETDIVLRAKVLATDDLAQARMEAAEFHALDRLGRLDWNAVLTLDALCSGAAGRAGADDVTVFKSLGIAMEDVALAAWLYRRAAQDHAADGWPRTPSIARPTTYQETT